MSFYGIFIPSNKENEREIHNVFTDKQEAFQLLKNHKEARLKEFKTSEEATNFSKNGIAVLPVNTTMSASPANSLDKSPFRSLKSQELVAFRKSIEQGKLDVVHETIWDNPRYLIGSGDTPTILKESTRYNALHVAVLAKNAKMCELILKTIGDPFYIELVHNNKHNPHICEEISKILLDLYLNMPEKGRNETPLHLAVKFGCVEVVEVLTSYVQCSYTVNSDGKYPKDIICFRCLDTASEETINRISELLEERFYVPVIRSIDNSIPPIIGEPFSPSNPPNFVFDALSPEMQIQACAGPMSKEKAEVFRKRWKTPPRSTPERNLPLNFPRKLLLFNEPNSENAPCNNNLTANTPVANDNESAHEIDRNSNNVTNGNSDSFDSDLYKMYRNKPLIDLNVSSASSEASDRCFDSPMRAERHVKLSDTEKGLEVIGREIAKDQNVKWQEYWNFLGDFVDIASSDGLNKLEHHLRKAHSKNASNNKVTQFGTPISNLCNRLSNLEVNVVDREWDKTRTKSFIKSVKKVDMSLLPTSVPTSFGSPYSCVDKSCQVYSKRLAVSILYNLDSVISVNDVLQSELKRLNSLISSYKADARFHYVNFQATHSRFASLIVYYLMLNNCNLTKFKNSLNQISDSTRKIVSESYAFRKESLFVNIQQICVIDNLLRVLDSDEFSHLIPPEVMTTEQDFSELWQSESKCDCTWSNDKSRQQRRCRPKFVGNSSFLLNENDLQTNEETNKLENTQRWSRSQDSSDDEFFSDAENSDNENEMFYTPPSSPSQLMDDDEEMGDQSILQNSYSTYLLGDEPTKTDMHVLNALKNVEIDKTLYPHINQWKAALLQHTQEEIQNFPSPCVIVKGRQTSDLSVRKLFQSPMKFQLSPVKKTVRFSNFFRPKSFSFSSADYSTDSDASPLARMAVSPIDNTPSPASPSDSAILK
ncbi:Ankyrin repeat and LEM domain-containing protein 2 like [Pseudolycoriella hygida]|uniref:Ankyrin repeat and LEM domain-containing protein 2 like n=1 Tax=Pseudolycoriella hygida TaxID=35572 RepID=A0A9Q0MSE8_9DIPT|nr:Ankyrin repeat and LEM domain-containing protein 2 like [Pseudolycoriella hygida]